MAKEKKRREILKAAEDLFLSHRFDQVTMDQVRQKAGVGKGTLYRYFSSKDDLFGQVILSGLDDLHSLMKQEVERADSPTTQLLAAARTMQGFHRQQRSMFRTLHAEWVRGILGNGQLRDELRTRRRRTGKLLASIFRSGMEKSEFRNDLPPAVAARMFMAAIRSAVSGGMDGDSQRIPLERALAVVMEGLRSQ